MVSKKDNQYNKGFTLIEVLVAVIIISIVCIPIFRALVTAVKTTARSKEKMVAQNAASDIMEDLESLNIAGVIEKYGASSDEKISTKNEDSTSPYTFNFTGKSEIAGFDKSVNEALKKGYDITITIDPSKYSNTNSVNMGEFNTVSSDSAGILSLSSTTDSKVSKDFEDLNADYRLTDSGKSAPVTSQDDFLKLLKREIRIDIEKTGTFIKDGESYDKVTVDATVSYLLAASDNTQQLIASDESTSVTKVTRQIFNNSSSEVPLSAIFIMYEPLYDACAANSDFNGDIITVHNRDNIETDLYVVAQNTTGGSLEDYMDKNKGGLILEIYEDEISGDEGKEQPIRLFTNLIDSSMIEYTKDSTDNVTGAGRQVPMLAYLSVNKNSSDPEEVGDKFDDTLYNRLKNKKGSFGDKDASYALKVRTLDGKTGDASSIEARIYDVTVTVSKNLTTDDTTSTEWPVSVLLQGTMLDYEKDE